MYAQRPGSHAPAAVRTWDWRRSSLAKRGPRLHCPTMAAVPASLTRKGLSSLLLLVALAGVCIWMVGLSGGESTRSGAEEQRAAVSGTPASVPANMEKKRSMQCGESGLCGVLTLEIGTGPDYYHHRIPTVHGLWPQIPPYGDSACVAPSSRQPERSVPECYDPDINVDDEMSFVEHEWTKHGKCAGVASEKDYFDQVCALSDSALSVMTLAKARDSRTESIANALRREGYPVHTVDYENAQVMLSVCARPSAQGGAPYTWHLALEHEFDFVCPARSPPPVPPHNACVPNEHGPPCRRDSDCQGKSGCVRCARSGFCTQTPLQETSHECVRGRRGPKCSTDAECRGVQGCARCARSGFCTRDSTP